MSRVRIPAEADILDSIVDFTLTNFFEFSIENYKYYEFFSKMENQVCERTSFGAVHIRSYGRRYPFENKMLLALWAKKIIRYMIIW